MTARVAWLGMYDHIGQAAANDRLWRTIAERLIARGIRDVPATLDRTRAPAAAWSSPDLLFGQICTRPLVREHPTLQVLAHPVYRVAADPGFHRSLVVVRADSSVRNVSDLSGATVAINDVGSNTGVALLRDLIAPIAKGRPFFGRVTATGSHRSSAIAVSEGQATLASIDEVTWATLERHEPALTGALRVIARSAPAATPPFVTGRGTAIETVSALRMVLADVIADPGLSDIRDSLFLTGIVPPRSDLIERVDAHERNAACRIMSIFENDLTET